MKDMTVKELIVKCGVGWNDFKAELLRRFEALKCCGNCTQHESRQCPKYDEYRRTGLWTLAWHYCDHYKSDGLTREEREGK